jgi:hypothetical protein
MGKLTKKGLRERKKMFAEGWPIPVDKQDLSIMNAMADLRADSRRKK